MNSKRTLARTFVVLAIIGFATAAIFLMFNVGGLRARILARLVRVENWPILVSPPANFQPKVPPGFKVSVFARGFAGPRWLAVAPNGDVFVADSSAGEVIVLRECSDGSAAESRVVFADHLNLPFGIAFHGNYVYIAETNEVLRFRYDPESSKRLGDPEHLLGLPGLGYHRHWTRSLAFSCDDQKLFVSVGSKTNVSIESDPRRAAVLVSDPDGRSMRVYASGLRNAVGVACNPESGRLWATINERDDIGDNVPSDYFTHLEENGFYGWLYAYDDRHAGDRVKPRPDLVAKVIAPDVVLGAPVAPLQFAFYEKRILPPKFWHGALIAERGSWNRHIRSGYQVVFIPFHDGSAMGEAAPFFTGFVPDPAGKEVYGRMVGVAVADDGALLIADDGAKMIWRVSYGPDDSRGVSEGSRKDK